MKKLLLLLLIIFTAGISYSQIFLRAVEFTVGIKKETGISWAEPTESDVLIAVYDSKVIIHSKVRQEYRKINRIQKTESSSKWRTLDADGKECNIFIFFLKDTPEYAYIGVEYNDIIWYYTTKPE